VFRGVNAGKNNDEVLEALKALGAGTPAPAAAPAGGTP
jgi:hypothetical protein